MDRKFAFILVVLSAFCGCRLFDPDYQAITSPSGTRLIVDSAEVQSLIAEHSVTNSHEEKELHRSFVEHNKVFLRTKGKRTPEERDADAARLRELRQHPERHIPQRLMFLDKMAQAPSIVIPGASYCRILQRSDAICSRDPILNPEYIKVRITSGPLKGQEGWGCLGDGIGLTVASL